MDPRMELLGYGGDHEHGSGGQVQVMYTPRAPMASVGRAALQPVSSTVARPPLSARRRSQQAVLEAKRGLSFAAQQRLTDALQRLDSLQEVAAQSAQIHNTFYAVSNQVPEERKKIRDRERLLAMELAEIDAVLGQSRSRLARLRAETAVLSQAAAQRSVKPVAMEAAWATSAGDSPGPYIISNTAFVSPHCDLLCPNDDTLVAVLPPSTPVEVLEIERRPNHQRLRARIEMPPGWISLLNLETGMRWAIRKADDLADNDLDPAATVVEDNAASRSAALRGWRARVDTECYALQDTIQSAIRYIGGTSPSARMGASGKAADEAAPVPVHARRLSSTAHLKRFAALAAEVKTEELWRDIEVARMELADEESHAAALSMKVQNRQLKNKQLYRVNMRLQELLDHLQRGRGFIFDDTDETAIQANELADKLFPIAGPTVTKSSSFFPGANKRGRSKEQLSHDSFSQDSHSTHPHPASLESMHKMSKEAKASSLGGFQEGAATISPTEARRQRMDLLLRKAGELQRQRTERAQEIIDLRVKLGPLKSASAKTALGMRHAAAKRQLHHLQFVICRLTCFALSEMSVVRKWQKAVQVRMAWMLEALSAPVEVRRNWLLEALGETILSVSPMQSRQVSATADGAILEDEEFGGGQTGLSRQVTPGLSRQVTPGGGDGQWSRQISDQTQSRGFDGMVSPGFNRMVSPGFQRLITPGTACLWPVPNKAAAPRQPPGAHRRAPDRAGFTGISVTQEEFLSALRDALALFRPRTWRSASDLQPVGTAGSGDPPDGAQALWLVASAIASIQMYARAELAELPKQSAGPIDRGSLFNNKDSHGAAGSSFDTDRQQAGWGTVIAPWAQD